MPSGGGTGSGRALEALANQVHATSRENEKMVRRVIIRSIMAGMSVLGAVVLPACTQEARTSKLTGDGPSVHERHDTGIDSQAGDN